MRCVPLAVAALAALAVLPAASAVVTVEPSGAGDYPTLQEGLAAAADGDTVLAYPGVYTGPDNADLDFQGRRVRLLALAGPSATTIDCMGAVRAFYFHSGEDTSAVVRGFSIVRGSASKGGGAYVTDASPTFRDCIFSDCAAGEDGGAISLTDGGLVVEDCVFEGNTATQGGAGIRCINGSLIIRGCQFLSNEARTGAGANCSASECLIEDSLFSENDGRGLYLSTTTGTVTGCTFEYNEGSAGAGAEVRYGSPAFTDCVFRRNKSTGNGGGMNLYAASPTLTRCLFAVNYAWRGAGICAQYASASIVDCGFINNYAMRGGQAIDMYLADISTTVIAGCYSFGRGGWTSGRGVFHFEDCYPQIERTSIAYSGSRPITCDGLAAPVIRNCIVYANATSDSLCGDHSDNLFTDPLWCNPYNEDFEVCENSPCLPAHNPWGLQVGHDGQGCGECITPVEASSWGAIKAMFR